MKLYRTVHWDADEGQCYEWFSSKAGAEKALRQMQRERGEKGEEYVEAVEIPTSKVGLIAWLNSHFTRDNG